MRVLTVRQPWAALIMVGVKTIETRSKKTLKRGRIGIHSSRTPGQLTKQEADDIYSYIPDDAPYISMKMQKGYILGTVDIVDCVEAGDWVETMRKNNTTFPDYEREWALGDLSTDRWAYVLKDPVIFPTPIYAKGALGFWEYSALDQLV